MVVVDKGVVGVVTRWLVVVTVMGSSSSDVATEGVDGWWLRTLRVVVGNNALQY